MGFTASFRNLTGSLVPFRFPPFSTHPLTRRGRPHGERRPSSVPLCVHAPLPQWRSWVSTTTLLRVHTLKSRNLYKPILKLLTTALIHFILFWYIANILPCALLLILLEKIQKFPRFFNLFSKRVDKTLKKANPHLLSFVFYYSHFGCLRNFSWYTNHWLNQDAIFYKPQGFLFTVFLKHLYFSEFTFLNFHKTFQETRVALLSERIVDERFLNTPALL